MLGKFFRQSLQKTNVLKSLRHAKAHEFVCLRESFNPAAAQESAAKFKSVLQQYNLKSHDLMHLIRWLNLDLETMKSYIGYQGYSDLLREASSEWRASPFFDSSESFENYLRDAKQKYPDVVDYAKNYYGEERKKALIVLEDIFVYKGPKENALLNAGNINNCLRSFKNKIDSYVFTLRENNDSDPELVKDIERSLNDLLKAIKSDPIFHYGLVRHYLDKSFGRTSQVTQLTSGKDKSIKPSKLTGMVAYSAGNTAVAPIDLGDDLPSIIENELSLVRGTMHYNFLPWDADRLMIFEAHVDKAPTFLLKALAGVFGFSFLYFLYQGDAHTSTLVLLPILTALLAFKTGRNKFANSFEYLVQMNLNRDGKTLDLFLQRPNKSITKVEGVPIKDFKVYQGGYDIPPVTAEIKGRKEFKFRESDKLKGNSLSRLRYAGGALNSHIATFGDRTILVPFNWKGNKPILYSVFAGKDVNLA